MSVFTHLRMREEEKVVTIDIGKTVVKKIEETQGTEISERVKKGGREVTSNKNLKARCMKPQRHYGTSTAVSPWHSTSKGFTPSLRLLWFCPRC